MDRILSLFPTAAPFVVPPNCQDQLRAHGETLAFYLLAVLDDGDYLNDWLAHLPACSAGAVQGLGMILATLLGYPA
jgi:hypothetical protein